MSDSGRRRSRAPAATGDVAELLRHLSDDRWLSAHPYATELDARRAQPGVPAGSSSAAALLRSSVLLAVGRLRAQPANGARLHAIASRCDLDGELHKAVAADLGLSRRQFYRDLAGARGLIDREVRAAARRAPEKVAAPAPSDDARFKTAIVLSAGGHGKAAVDHFAPAVDALEGAAAVWGHCVLASLLLDDGDAASAQRELDLAAQRCEGAESWTAEHVLLTRAKLLHQTGRATEAARALEGLVGRLEPLARDGSPLAVDTLSEALALLAFCCHERGDFAAAARCDAGNPAALPAAGVSPFARRLYLNVNAMLACDGRAGPGAARQTCDAFYRFAVANGFLDDVAAALLQLAGIARFERRLAEAERLAGESLAIQRAIGGGDAPILGMLASIAIERGAYERAVAIARTMRDRAAPGSHAWWGAQLHEADALCRASRPAPALEICLRVARESDGLDARIAAWLHRIEATIFQVLGDDDESYRAAGAALEILGTDAPPFHRLKSLLVAARARPSRSYRDEIGKLTQLLGWPAPA